MRPGELELAGALQLALDACEHYAKGETEMGRFTAHSAQMILTAWIDGQPTRPPVLPDVTLS